MTNEQTTKNAPPVFKARAGRFDVAVWENEVKGQSGRTFTQQSVTLRKSWTKDGKKWEEQTIGIFSREVPDALLALQKAFEHMRLNSKSTAEAEE
jgi:hypothetical protein